ncbi:MAG: iron ABC transporter permease [Pseudomonadota bacterium]
MYAVIAKRPSAAGFVSASLLLGFTWLSLNYGAAPVSTEKIFAAVFQTDANDFEHFVIKEQRLPRILIAGFVGAMMAAGGAVLQTILANPLASPALLGITSGTTLFVVVFGFGLALPTTLHAPIAAAGGLFGFLSCLLVARFAAYGPDPRHLTLILSGAIVSIFYSAITQAILLSNAGLRHAALSWTSGNINHFYIDRLHVLWPIGLLCLVILLILSRPIMLVSISDEKASSAGVSADKLKFVSFALVVVGCSSAVAVCGPIAFIGLVVPHVVRPFVGAHLGRLLPVSIIVGSTFCVAADLVARFVFAPLVVNTSVILNLVGGLFFILLVRRFYLVEGGRRL